MLRTRFESVGMRGPAPVRLRLRTPLSPAVGKSRLETNTAFIYTALGVTDLRAFRLFRSIQTLRNYSNIDSLQSTTCALGNGVF